MTLIQLSLGKARLQRTHYRRLDDDVPCVPLCREFEIAMLEYMTPSVACNEFRHCGLTVTEGQEIWANR